MKFVVTDVGYVGLTTGVALAYLGHQVACVAKDPGKLELLFRGKTAFMTTGWKS